MCSGKLQKNAARAFLHRIQVRAYSFALLVTLARDLFFVRNDAHCPAHVYKDSAALDSLNYTSDNLTLFLAVFSENRDFFCLTDLLNDNLLCRLGGDATIVAFDFEREDYLIAYGRAFLYPLCVLDENMMLGIVTDLYILGVHVLSDLACPLRLP